MDGFEPPTTRLEGESLVAVCILKLTGSCFCIAVLPLHHLQLSWGGGIEPPIAIYGCFGLL